jgi:hypothetical protein
MSTPRPWTKEYVEGRQETLCRIIRDQTLLEGLAAGRPLPAGHGAGLDERCVEYPWALAQLKPGPERLLDAGSALNHPWLLELPLFQGKGLHVLTLAPEPYCAWHMGFSYLFADLRDIPVRDGYYGRIVCISTLEHVGFDNSVYAGEAHCRCGSPEEYKRALLELRRVLAPGGELLVTLPFGRREDLVLAQQFDPALLAELIAAFAPAEVEKTFYRYGLDGWRLSDEAACAEAAYARWAIDYFLNPGGYDLAAAPVDADRAPAARAVACVRLVKRG